MLTWIRAAGLLSAAGLVSSGLSGCFALAATGLVVGALSVTDRRTTGAQADDQAIEIKAANRMRERYGSNDAVSVSITSFNRIALITGYVPSANIRQSIQAIVSEIDNVRQVVNELQIAAPVGVTTYGKDSFLSARVKTAFIETKNLNANVIKVTSETATVYLMGMVTAREADLASEVAARVPGVRRVVRAFEVLSDAQIQAIDYAILGGKSTPAATGRVSTGVRSGQN